ncbi:acyl-CoA dehydrogenase family protein [Halobacillus sp. MO56]
MNFYHEDPNLAFQMKKMMKPQFNEWAVKELEEFGAMCAGEIDVRAKHTDREGQPRLIKYDRMGEDISEVWLNEGYMQTVKETYEKGIVGFVHKPIPELGHKGNYIYSFAQGYLLSHAEPGFYCPVTLTMATAYLIDHYGDEALKAKYLPHVLATGDTELYEGATFLTERQGGSDVGANEVYAAADGESYRIYGEKYFASNAGACGVAMVLARMKGAPPGTKGLSLFLVPWRNEDGKLNHIKIRRLKDKLGVRAVPSAKVEFEGAHAYLVGKADRGFYYMMEALNLSRICNAVTSIGIMRRAYIEAREYATERKAFGDRLIQYPMVQDTLIQMAVKQEVETSTVFDMISLLDRVSNDPHGVSERDAVLNRLYIAIMKKETAEQAIHFSHEAIEMHGGNGYIEDFVTPRLLRDAQVLTVWEGTANILGLEVMRLIHKYQAYELFYEEMESRLARIEASIDQKWLQPVLKALDDDKAYLGKIVKKSKQEQTYYSKRIAKRLSKSYEGVVALEEAATGEERKQKIAEVYITQTFKEDNPKEEALPLQYFDSIVNPGIPAT